MRGLAATRAYQQSARHRSVRDQEADVFRGVNARLRAAQDEQGIALTRALADNGRLWTTLLDLIRDPANPMPTPLKASILSVGLAVQREAAQDTPDLPFLIGINEQLAAGLSGG